MQPLRNITGATAVLEAHKMKLRILAALVLVPLLLVVVFLAPKVVTVLIVGQLCALAVYELLWSTGILRQTRAVIYTAVMAFSVPLWCYFGMEPMCARIAVLAFFSLLFGEMLYSHGKLRLEKGAVCIVAGLVLPYMLSALVRILGAEQGRAFLFIPFVAAFCSDSGAYFVGIAWGRHKLAPNISPKKSIEGMFGGILFAILSMVIYTLILAFVTKMQPNYLFAVIYGLLGALGGVFGDLCFSVIKRQTGIKDYGCLIPGHGGILDRFDSVMIVAPLMEILLLIMPILE